MAILVSTFKDWHSLFEVELVEIHAYLTKMGGLYMY